MKRKHDYFILLIPILYAVIAVLIVGTVMKNGVYPEGSDTMYHVYRGDFIYRAVKEGNWYPMFAKEWYNGVELLRYWAPLPAYFMAFCIFLAAGDVLDGYLIFVGLIFFLGAMSWLWIGWKKQRICLGAFLGVLWFFMPNNLLALFTEGNLARCVCMVFLPLFIYFVGEYLETRKSWWVLAETVLFSLMALCHLGYAGMIALAMLLYLLVYRIIYGADSGSRHVIWGILLGFLLIGVWMLPSLSGGITGLDNSENMARFFQSVFLSLDPFDRYVSGFRHFYFGLAAFLITVTGMLIANKRSRVGFFVAFLIFLCTSSSAYYVLKVLPGSQYLWMLRFISIALCMILYSLLNWKSLKKYILFSMLCLLVLDVIPSLPQVYGNQDGTSAKERMTQMQSATLIQEGLELTEQRMALMDASTLGATGAFLVTGWQERRDATFGAGWEAAVTARNIRNLNTAFEGGYFDYMFDRCMELGNDTIVVKKSCLPQETDVMENLASAAKLRGYILMKEQGEYQLYHLEGAKGNWGLKSRYESIAIGEDSFQLAVQFPSIEEGKSNNLSDYTYEELAGYHTIYLGSFCYDDKAGAEDLIVRLSEAGVNIVISADGIPEDRETRSQSFLGVRCEKISFHNGYPELMIHDKLINPDLFPSGYSHWDTVYTEGLDKVYGYLVENDLEIPFFGTVKNDHITLIGLRLPQFCNITKDRTVTEALGDMLGCSRELLPEREIIPITVEYGKNSIKIVSPENDVNTTISYHTIFHSRQEIQDRNHLLVVHEGTTEIVFICEEMKYGLLLSGAGLLLAVLYIPLCKRKRRKEAVKVFTMKVLITGEDSELRREVLREVENRGFEGTVMSCEQLDLEDDYSIEHAVGQEKWDVVIHCAAFVQLDKTEQEGVLYWREEVPGTRQLRDACIAYNIPLIETITNTVQLPITAKELAKLLVDRI